MLAKLIFQKKFFIINTYYEPLWWRKLKISRISKVARRSNQKYTPTLKIISKYNIFYYNISCQYRKKPWYNFICETPFNTLSNSHPPKASMSFSSTNPFIRKDRKTIFSLIFTLAKLNFAFRSDIWNF